MFCPSCGSEESQSNQYCRACGANLNAVRAALERPDAITSSAISARDEIGRAVAAKIKETTSASELRQVTWELLPVVAEFLESPEERRSKREERRLERIRAGVITASVGLGVALFALVFSLFLSNKILALTAPGLLTFLIGIGLVINGLVFSVQRMQAPERTLEPSRQNVLDQLTAAAHVSTNELASEARPFFSTSVTEHTTHQLSDKH